MAIGGEVTEKRGGIGHGMRMNARLRRWLVPVIGALSFGFLLLSPFVWQCYVNMRYTPAIHTVEDAPSARVALVLGARVYNSGRLSAMLRDRVDTAVDLYKAGKVDKLLVSGDNSSSDYDEPGAMMAHAIELGVAPEDIQPDYGGRRTYDSCYRAKAVFQVDEAIVVTQAFHLPRALFLCESLGLRVSGVSADQRTYDPRSIAWSETREVPALVAALFDVIRRAPPPVLGDPIPIQ